MLATPNGKTSETVPAGDANRVAEALKAKGLTALATDTEPTDASKAAEQAKLRRELLSATAEGRAVLAEEARTGK
jgi:hypothetical protein